MAPAANLKSPDDTLDDESPPSNQSTHDRTPASSLRTKSPSAPAISLVSVTDDGLRGIAAATREATDWETILLSARAGPGRWRMQHTAGEFNVYTRQESSRFGVLAVGLVDGGAGEVMNLLQCQGSAQYAQQMAAIFADQFKDGSFVHQARLPPRERIKDQQAQLVDLSVKTVTFQKTGWLGSHEQWCYLDAVYRHGLTGATEKLMTTLEAKVMLPGGASTSRAKSLHGVTCAYLLLPEQQEKAAAMPVSNQDDNDSSPPLTSESDNKSKTGRTTRVHFYSEYVIPKHFGFRVTTSASEKHVKQRLLRLADSCARLDKLVQRQRLGVQDVVDYTRLLPPTNTPCMVCTKMLIVAKVCRLCGMGVCTDCSQKHEREAIPPGSTTVCVESIRVCATCLYRVNRACYDNLTPSSLRGPHIVPDPIDTTPPNSALRGLLHDALVRAPSPSRKAGVMSVIKCILEQNTTETVSASPPAAPQLTPRSSEQDYLAALEYLEVERVPHDKAECRTHEERCYRVAASDPNAALDAPLSEQEEARLRAVEEVDMDELAESVELQLLCQLAAQEMGCSTSTISIFDRDSLNCVATNVDAYAKLKLPRWNTICAHTILDKRPHLIPHPEADIRMADTLVVTGFGVRFYFAFPVVATDGQIIGSYCVMDEQSHAISESQYAAFQKLAQTCNKVVQLHTETRRRRTFSTASSSTLSTSSVSR